VTIREHCEMTGFRSEASRAVALTTTQGEIPGEAFVVAAGAWTPLLDKHLGCRVPIQPGKGYSITMGRPKLCPVWPMLFEEHRVAVTVWPSGYRLGSTMEFAGYDATLNRSRLELLREGARPYLHEPFGEPVVEEWYGWRPMTYDGKPIIDRSPTLSNVMIAAGHNMIGVAASPATGKLVAEMLSNEPPHIDVTPFSAKRF
jgi:D-amino-acid dehydrogenase